MFRYKTRVAFYETDAMGVLHHSNYVRLAERARVEWLRESGVMASHIPHGPEVFAVVNMSFSFSRPVRFDEEVEIEVSAKVEGVRLIIDYLFWALSSEKKPICRGQTALVTVDHKSLKPKRMPTELTEAVARLADSSNRG